ncbi:hypothetical protein GCM10010232_03730 [Streptomyces amakusaensis]|uniref:Uncharacterized protein n=1 Tax=Streptomyces inusitatus TaxID=68221 RepID=A0A918QFY8_9ACTN|nr:hypothetical protein GCM10010387_45210 [Streptomyces inusitatus]
MPLLRVPHRVIQQLFAPLLGDLRGFSHSNGLFHDQSTPTITLSYGHPTARPALMIPHMGRMDARTGARVETDLGGG